MATIVGVWPLPGQTTVDATISHLAAQRALVLVEALGGKLEIHAVFDDADIKLTAGASDSPAMTPRPSRE